MFQAEWDRVSKYMKNDAHLRLGHYQGDACHITFHDYLALFRQSRASIHFRAFHIFDETVRSHFPLQLCVIHKRLEIHISANDDNACRRNHGLPMRAGSQVDYTS
jgi:hypothetical protein